MATQRMVTRAQTKFLRAFARDPFGPPAEQWPSPMVLRRWLKRPGFCGAMDSILRALRYQADFHLTAAAASGAHRLHETVGSGDLAEVRKHIESLVHLLRMAHVRHRFAEPLPQPERRSIDFVELLRRVHPSITVQAALQGFDLFTRDGRPPGEPGPGQRLWERTGHPMWQTDAPHCGRAAGEDREGRPTLHEARAVDGDEGRDNDNDDEGDDDREDEENGGER